MTEPDQPLLETPAEDAPKKPTKRRTTAPAKATRSKAKKTAATEELVAPAEETRAPELALDLPVKKAKSAKAANTRQNASIS